jgi:hypothetical protein
MYAEITRYQLTKTQPPSNAGELNDITGHEGSGSGLARERTGVTNLTVLITDTPASAEP